MTQTWLVQIRAKKFLSKLRGQMKKQMISFELTTYVAIVIKAHIVKLRLKEFQRENKIMNQRKKKKKRIKEEI